VKKIKDGLINEEIVRRYPGSDIGGNYVIDKGKGSGPRSDDYGKVVAEELGDLDANMSGGADVRGIKPSFVRDKTRWHSQTKEEETVMKKSDKFILFLRFWEDYLIFISQLIYDS